MASQFTLTAKFAIGSSILVTLSFGLCSLGGLGGSKAGAVLFPAGLIALGLGILGFIVTVIVAIIEAIRSNRRPGPPPSIAPPPPPNQF